ncbi:MAG: chromosomal replication initiation protein [Microgenomates group bacterium GW2011_GWA2_44_7]|nr:MAG: chromosomal replication initiation protein [Microgenomates group bacterium GW2011_GWA2_44_7]
MLQEELDGIWKSALEQLKLSVSRGTYTAYFSSSNLRSIKEVDEQRQIAEIALANAFLRENVEQRYWSIVKEAIDTVTGKKNDLVFSVDLIEKKITERLPQRHDTDGFEKIEGLFDRDLGMATEARAKRANLRPDFIFENFAVSSSNQMAWAAASAVAKSPGNTYNPLFFYGGVGVGKTIQRKS